MSDEPFAKVTYKAREGYITQAYINPETGFGTSKHTGIEVQLEWSDEEDVWIQVDDWEWDFDWEGTPSRKVPHQEIETRQGQRWQPKSKKRSKNETSKRGRA